MSPTKDDDICQMDAEKELICNVKSGDKEAQGEFFSRYLKDVHGYAEYLTNDCHISDDVLQETMLDAFASIDKYKDIGFGIKPWLFKIARCKVAEYFRGKKRHSHVSIDCVDNIHCETKKVEHIDLEYLNVLSEDEKRVFTLRYLDELSRDQIAEQLKISVQKVDRRLRNAKLHLKERIQREYKQ